MKSLSLKLFTWLRNSLIDIHVCQATVAALDTHGHTHTAAFQKAVVSRSMYRQVLQAVEKHHNHAVLVESALEVIIILSQNGKLSLKLSVVLMLIGSSLSTGHKLASKNTNGIDDVFCEAG